MPSPRLPTLGNRTRSSALAYGIDGAPLPPDYEPPLPPDEASSPTTDAKLALDAAALQKSIMKAGRIRVGYRGRLLQPKDQPLINGIHSTDVSYIADRRGHGRSTSTCLDQESCRADQLPAGILRLCLRWRHGCRACASCAVSTHKVVLPPTCCFGWRTTTTTIIRDRSRCNQPKRNIQGQVR